MTTSTLSFTVRPATTRYDLRRVCEVRAESYGHHMPEWRDSLAEPDGLDTAASTLVLLCEDKCTGAPIGTPGAAKRSETAMPLRIAKVTCQESS